MFHRFPKSPSAVRVSLSPLLVDSFHFARWWRGFQNHPLVRRRVPRTIPVITTGFAVLIPWMWKPPLRRRVVISNTHNMMIIRILNARIHHAHPGEFALVEDLAEQDKANKRNDDAEKNVIHSEYPQHNPRRRLL